MTRDTRTDRPEGRDPATETGADPDRRPAGRERTVADRGGMGDPSVASLPGVESSGRADPSVARLPEAGSLGRGPDTAGTGPPTAVQRRSRTDGADGAGTCGDGAADARAGEAGVPEAVRAVLSSPGQSLEPSVREEMEDRMGDAFDDVRVHAGPRAAAACQRLDARAFTVGNHVAFGRGEYDPDSPAGKHVLAHELAHVRQQTAGRVSMLPRDGAGEGGIEVDPDPRLEREAERAAAEAMAGEGVVVNRMGTDVHVQRLSRGSEFLVGDSKSRRGERRPSDDRRRPAGSLSYPEKHDIETGPDGRRLRFEDRGVLDDAAEVWKNKHEIDWTQVVSEGLANAARGSAVLSFGAAAGSEALGQVRDTDDEPVDEVVAERVRSSLATSEAFAEQVARSDALAERLASSDTLANKIAGRDTEDSRFEGGGGDH